MNQQTQCQDRRTAGVLRGVFNEILPRHGYAPREKQTGLAEEILAALRHSDVLLAEAEIGTGKTLAYLIPAALTTRLSNMTAASSAVKQPVVIATSSIALQRAIERDCIPKLSEILMKHGVIDTPLTCVLRKGKSHFVCERRLGHYYFFADDATKSVLKPLLHSGFLDLSMAKNLTPGQKRAVCVTDRCDRDCPRRGECRYLRYLREAQCGGYDFQICNHNYLLADVLRRTKKLPPLIPDYSAVVIDEAHKLDGAARQMYGCGLSLTELLEAAKDAREITFTPEAPTAEVHRRADRLRTKSELLFRLLNKETPENTTEDGDTEQFRAVIREKAEQLLRALKKDADVLAELLEAKQAISKYEAERGALIRTLKQISDSLAVFAGHSELVCLLERDTDGKLTILRGIPKELRRILQRDLWSMQIPFVLTSGTLSAAGNFERVKHKLGLDLVSVKRLRETTKPSPFDYKQNALLYIGGSVPFPDNSDESYITAAAAETERLICAANGHTAVLFTSYGAMNSVFERISACNLPYPLFRLDKGGSAAAIERFRRSGNGVLFASGALWEGIDLPGDVLSMLIIVRLPFAVPDPVSEWERGQYSGLTEYKNAVVVPEMLVRLRQGFGRLIRGETDSGVAAILDCRAGSRGAYGRQVLSALPECGVTEDLQAVKEFLRVRKDEAFWAA
ncbi:MAG: ATP-dependent DNA helicase [Oscillospiraceae bacterium]|jgi:ATP-dependent DNA helicase DinG|nr:ATP-dependent DNA helicase [Oscillospiraceae bacterium]